MKWSKSNCEYLRMQVKQKFDNSGARAAWIEWGGWTLPHRIKFMLSQEDGERTNKHIVDPTHLLALRSYVAGFLEGNTSASRPWYRITHEDPDINSYPENREWLDVYTNRTLSVLNKSNFYNAAGAFYYDFGVFNTGAHYIEELPNGQLHFHTLEPGSYYLLNNGLGIANVMVREFDLTVKALVDTYGKKDKKGNYDWSNFSSNVKKMYNDGNYTTKISVVQVIKENENFDINQPMVGLNRQWISLTYELGGPGGQYYQDGQEFGFSAAQDENADVYLRKSASKRKPFIVGRSDAGNNFEYGQKGPTSDALGLIKSLNKKAIGKDIALDQMVKPTLQGPASLRKSYISNAPNSYVPLDAASYSQGGLKPVFEISPAIATLNADVNDLRNQVERLYYADYLLYLTRNPKTRTATETNAVIQEQQLIIGPNLQSLNWTYNTPLIEFVMSFVLDEDPYLPPAPEGLQGEWLHTDFISVFAQAQKAADLPAIDRYIGMIANVGQLRPEIWDNANLDKLAQLYEDRLYLPAGLNNPQSKVDALRQQAQAAAQRNQMLNETLPNMAGVVKDLGASPIEQQ